MAAVGIPCGSHAVLLATSFYERWISPSRRYSPAYSFPLCLPDCHAIGFSASYFPVCAVYPFIAGHPGRSRVYEVLKVFLEPGAGIGVLAVLAFFRLFAVFCEFAHLHPYRSPFQSCVIQKPPVLRHARPESNRMRSRTRTSLHQGIGLPLTKHSAGCRGGAWRQRTMCFLT